MNLDQAAIFVLESPKPTSVIVYPNLDWARGSLDSLDVAGGGYELAFTATGQIVQVAPSDDLFARFEVTEQVGLNGFRPYSGLQGPAHLADDPSAYAQEWMRLEDLDAERPPFVPQRVWSWYRSKVRTVPDRTG